VVDPAEFLVIADRLRASGVEADRRTSIGRSYYSLYNLVCDALSAAGIPLPGGADNHRALVHFLTRCGDVSAANVGDALKTLRIRRNQSDYEMRRNIDVKVSQLAFYLANREFAQFRGLGVAQAAALVASIRALGPYTP
jgi:hypothetical protein